MITFSVMIPVYNAKSVLNRCIQSVLDQTEQNFELLLVDDGSTDGSGELCDQWGMQDPRVRVIHQQNKGVSATRNVLLANARGSISPLLMRMIGSSRSICRYYMHCANDGMFLWLRATIGYMVRIVNKYVSIKAPLIVCLQRSRHAMVCFIIARQMYAYGGKSIGAPCWMGSVIRRAGCMKIPGYLQIL